MKLSTILSTIVGVFLCATISALGQQAAAPTLNPPPNVTYITSVTVTMTSATAGATIYYTTDGSTPSRFSPNSVANGGSVAITASIANFKAVAWKSGMTESPVISGSYYLRAEQPTFSQNGGDFWGSLPVQITSATSGSTIYYTTDGSEPTGSSPSIYNGSSITLTNSAKIKAFARMSGGYDSTVGISSNYYYYKVLSTNEHYFYGNWRDPLFDDKMTAIKSGPPYNSGDQHFNFYTNTVIETKGAFKGFKVLSNWKFHGNGATLKLSKNIPEEPSGYISAHVFGAHDASPSGLVNSVLIEGFDINCNHDELSLRTNVMLKLRGIQLIGTQNEVRNCTVRQPIGWYGALTNVSEVFAIDLRTKHSNSWNNVISNCVVMDYRGDANTWVNGIAMSSTNGVTLSGTVQNCRVYGKGHRNHYGYNAQGPVSVVFDSNLSSNMNRGFNNDAGDGSNITWTNSIFHVPANAHGMYILASQNSVAESNLFYLNGVGGVAIALGGPWEPQLGARNWTFNSNWIELTNNYTNCWGIAFGTTNPPPPSYINLYNNRIDEGVTNRVSGGTGHDFQGNRYLDGINTPPGLEDMP